mgnify:CR=1 FL=1|jgi:hypothetical protein|tara:strand:- start:4 stop:351 length:348 start_codon:yes stop_codon:yes gene_type:complete
MTEELKKNIILWVELDNQISETQSKIREMKKTQKSIGESLTNVMRENELDVIDINKGQIRYIKNKVKKSINQKYLLDIMSKYCQNNEEASKICEYIQENREIQMKEKIQYKKDKI